MVGAASTYIAGQKGLLDQDQQKTWKEAGISESDATRIQNAANKTNQKIVVVGSRAAGTADERRICDGGRQPKRGAV